MKMKSYLPARVVCLALVFFVAFALPGRMDRAGGYYGVLSAHAKQQDDSPGQGGGKSDNPPGHDGTVPGKGHPEGEGGEAGNSGNTPSDQGEKKGHDRDGGETSGGGSSGGGSQPPPAQGSGGGEVPEGRPPVVTPPTTTPGGGSGGGQEQPPPRKKGRLREYEEKSREPRHEEPSEVKRSAMFMVFDTFIRLIYYITYLGHGEYGQPWDQYSFLKYPHRKMTGITAHEAHGPHKADEPAKEHLGRKKVAFELRPTYQREITGHFNGWGFDTALRTLYWITLRGDFVRYREPVFNGVDTTDFWKFSPRLSGIGKATVFELGGGVSGLSGQGTQIGPHWAFGFEIFAPKPFEWRFHVSETYLKDSTILDASGQLGIYYYKRLEFFAGYRTIAIEGRDALHGPQFGLGIWF